MRMMLLSVLALAAGCEAKDGTGTADGCPRDHTWRDPTDVSSGSATVLVTEGCDRDLVVTEVELKGPGFSADLPQLGDTIPAGTWEIEVFFDTALVTEPGQYSGVLYLGAEGLVEDSVPKDLYAVVE